ncbi:hypothetical protein LOK49_Contig432G00002, partial [Camellia lanceoleosa]
MMLCSLFTSCLSNELQKAEPVEKKLMDNIRQYQVPLQKYMAMMDLENFKKWPGSRADPSRWRFTLTLRDGIFNLTSSNSQ